jgi:hypothetical protein
MDESRRLAMRRAHARRANYCSCGKVVYGNGGRATHKAMHIRNQDGHRFMIEDRWRIEMARREHHQAITAS